MPAGRRVPTTISKATCRRTSQSGRVVSPPKPRPRVRAQSRARVRVLRNDLAELSRGHRDVHGPAHADDAIGEDAIRLGRPVRLAKLLERRYAEVIGHGARDLAVPGALL